MGVNPRKAAHLALGPEGAARRGPAPGSTLAGSKRVAVETVGCHPRLFTLKPSGFPPSSSPRARRMRPALCFSCAGARASSPAFDCRLARGESTRHYSRRAKRARTTVRRFMRSGTGVSPVRTGTHGRDARATTAAPACAALAEFTSARWTASRIHRRSSRRRGGPALSRQRRFSARRGVRDGVSPVRRGW